MTIRGIKEIKELLLVAFAYLFCTLSLNAAIFTPVTVTDLINYIGMANMNYDDDTIDLGGHTFILKVSATPGDPNGENGLPLILPDNNSGLGIPHTLLITGGTIERDPTAPGFRFLSVEPGANLTLSDVGLLRGLENDPEAFPTGGGAVLNIGTLTMRNCTLIDNHSSLPVFGDSGGGAVYNLGGLINAITGCYFLDNESEGNFGGAIINSTDDSGTIPGQILEISQSTFAGNRANVSGGAIANFGNIGTISDCLFFDNSAGSGGALFNNQIISTIIPAIDTIINSTFYGNTAFGNAGTAITSADGGAIEIVVGTINNIFNSTFSSNAAFQQDGSSDENGGAIYVSAALGATVNNLVSNIVAENICSSAPDIFTPIGKIVNASYNLIGTNSGHLIVNGVNNNQVGTDANPLDPLLSSPADHGGPTFTCEIAANSPALNAGNNPDNTPFDQRSFGFSRSVGQTDIGAFEVQDCR